MSQSLAMPSTDAPETPSEGKSFGTRLADGWDRATDHLPLASVPLLSSLLAVDNVRRVRAAEGVNVGVTFPFPAALPDLWTFVNVPNPDPGFHVSPTVAFLPVRVLVQAVLVAGLLGSIDEIRRTGRYDFAANARRYFAPMLGFVALVTLVTFSAVGFAAVSPLLLVVLVPVFLVLKYLFYATAYLVAVADESLETALTRSYRWATAGGPYLSYGAGYLLFAAAVSLVVSAVVVNLGVLGVTVGAVATAPVALALTFATTGFVADMDVGERADGGAGGDGRDRPGTVEEFDAAASGATTDELGPTADEFGPAEDEFGPSPDEPRENGRGRDENGGA